MCTTMCLHHKWLRRPTAPKIPKPVPAEAPKKALPATLVVEPEMRGSKGNLRSTVERWTEHPEDPYIFDTTCHTISPCPSLVSVLSAEPQVEAQATSTPPLSPAPAVPLKPTNLLHERLMAGTERRASDSSCMRLKSHHIDINDRINLADEIKKLSDKLFQMASQAPEQPLSVPVVTTENGRTKTTTTSTSTTTTFVQSVDGGDPISTTSKSKIVRTKYDRNDSALGSCFTAKANSTMIPTKKFWPFEPGRIHVEGTINPEEEAEILAAGLRNSQRRLSKDAVRPTRTLSSNSSNTTQSAPPSPRWSPDPELPPPPTSELTKDLLMRLFEKLDSNRQDEWRLGSGMVSPASRLLFTSPRPSLVINKKRTLITSHSGGI